MKPSQLPTVLDIALDTLQPVMLWGAPGIGKSQITRQWADRNDLPVIDKRLSQMEPSDLLGIPHFENGETRWARPEWFPTVEKHGPRGVLLLDEITSAPPSMAAAAYQLVLDRCIGDHHLPGGWLVIAAGNRLEDRGVVHAMPAPLANRFWHFTLEPELDDLRAYAIRQKWDIRIPAFLAFRPELMHSFDAGSKDPAFPSPRTWEFLNNALKSDRLPADLRHETFAGLVGKGAAVEFEAFIEMAGRVTPPDVALSNPNGAPIPTDKGVLFATVGALAAATTHENIGSAYTYVRRIEDVEFQVLYSRDIVTADSTLANTEAFISWSVDNTDVNFA